MTTKILIRKASGDEEEFHSHKLERSLANAGATEETIQTIVTQIRNWITPGITTKELYAEAFSLLKKESSSTSIRYKLKQAILELGPTGYPFESLIGQLFTLKGYRTEVGVVVKGQCITHEMDVIATKNKQQHIVECKYHKDQGKSVSIQVPLYVHSRVNDIIKTRKSIVGYQKFTFYPWVITNTRFSQDSKQYSRCNEIQLLGWDYPEGQGLKEQIEELKLYPITILDFTHEEKQKLLELKVVTCEQLKNNLQVLNSLELTDTKKQAVLEELEKLLL